MDVAVAVQRCIDDTVYSDFVEVNRGDGYQRKPAVISYRENDLNKLRVRVLPHQMSWKIRKAACTI
jgi:hypothetical protein